MLNLMIVDDEPIILKGLLNIVEKGNTPFANVVTAQDGVEALEKMKDYTPDLLITDIQMPEMNGIELIKTVKDRGYCNRFVILSGYDETEYLRQAIRCKVIDYLFKPINKTELYNILTDTSIEVLNEVNKSANPSTVAVLDSAAPAPIVNGHHLSKNIKKIIDYIDTNYAVDLSLDHIAEQVYLHPNYISYLFKKETGFTFIHYLHLYRIKKAKELIMRDPDLSFHYISKQVGYENVRHFFNVFKKYSDVTPGEYRDLYKFH